MRFEHERLTKDFIVRRIREEDRKVGRNVTKVILTRAEWAEFWYATKPGEFPPQYYRIALHTAPSIRSYNDPIDSMEPVIRTVDITYE